MKQNKSRKGTRKLQRRTPHGNTSVHYSKKKPKQAVCARCGAKLTTPRATPSKLRKMTRSQRSVSRRFGGVLCGKCVREVEKYITRIEAGAEVGRDLSIEKYLPPGWYKDNAKSKDAEKLAEDIPAQELKTGEPEKTSSKASDTLGKD